MGTVSGADLLETFHSLGINTGNVSKLTIDAWCDTDCEATKEMLHWLCKYLGKENVLTAHENEEYEQSLENNSLLVEKHYQNALAQMQSDYPGILDYDKNLFEVECMEDELAMLMEEERHLEQLLQVNVDLNKTLTKEIKKVGNEEITATVEKEAAQEKCVELSDKVDDAHEKLQQQISRYAEHLCEFEYPTRPTFISNIPTTKYEQYYSDVASYLGLFLKREYEVLPKLEVTTKSAKKKLLDSNFTDSTADQLEILRQRIFNSMENYLRKQVKEEKLKREIKFLRELDLSKVIASAPPDDSSQFLLEANIFSKEELLERVFLDMENVVRQICDGYVDTPKITFTENAINVNRKKLESLTQIDGKLTEVLAKHILLHLFLEKEKNDVQSTDKFFRDVHYYITQDLHNCQNRTSAMTETINDYQIYKNLPIDQKFKIANVIKALLNKNSSNITAIDAIRSFNNEYNKLENVVFVGDYAEHRQFAQKMERDIKVMRKFLISGPTNQITIIPHEIVASINKLNELHETQGTISKSAMQLLSDAEKKLSDNKWFRIRRQLWVWFLFQPKMILGAIEQMEAAIKQKRSEAT